jgi:allantoicase
MYGKWHLGTTKQEFLPLQNGFDEYVGLPYSNDMIPPKWPDIALMSGNDTLELNPDQTKLTKLYTQKAIDFIDKNSEKPFFIYLPFAMPHVPLNPGSQHLLQIADKNVYSHLRLHIYPDGGVARLKVYGEVAKDWTAVKDTEEIDLASALNGAKSVLCNDMFFSHMDNLIMPGRGINMGDGWETKRNRTLNNKDWVIVRLAHNGSIKNALIDTCHFKGNYPDSCMLEGCLTSADTDFTSTEVDWLIILPQQKLQADFEHFYQPQIVHSDKAFTHVRLTIFPDGGISRMRLGGTIY